MSKACSGCGRALGGQYLKAGAQAYHSECLRCGHCRQSLLNQAFTQHKGGLYHAACYKQKFRIVCDHCGELLPDQWLTYEGKKLHQACYQNHYQEKCVHCSRPITGSFHRDESGAWHVPCYDKIKAEPCSACRGPLKGKILLDVWGNKAHASHGGQRTLTCSICARLISQATSQGGVQYGDGRSVCGICRITEISTPAQIAQAKTTVIAQLQAAGFDYIPDYIAVTLADQRLMNKRLGVHSTSNSHGYTKTLEKRINGQIQREHSIFILYGLPRLSFMAVLAHELLHVWLNDRGIHHWSEREIEGFCNLGCMVIYQNDNTPLAQVLLKRMEEDKNPVYGDGYRLMRAKLQKQGWAGLIQTIQQPPTGFGAKIHKLNSFIDRII